MDALNDLEIVTLKMETAEKKVASKEERIVKMEQKNEASKEKQQGMFNLIQQLKQELSKSK